LPTGKCYVLISLFDADQSLKAASFS